MEDRLVVTGPIRGYLYAQRPGHKDDVLYRTVGAARYFWSYRQVCTQDNAGGGNLVVRVTPAANSAMVPITGTMVASGNRAAQITVENGDDDRVNIVSAIGAVASATAILAPVPGAATASSAAQRIEDKPIANPAYLEAEVSSAAQTETATITILCELIGTSTAPTVSWAASGGTPNAAAATENTVTEVVDERC